ncbi:TonB-dependent receptor [Alteromonas sp. 5E99-2]|uniref:TonB-dependent receptor n=1 Tax=Alteromonas sp. 5E99-2 TaxID=2817683 RepID=UPI001A989CD5|nr:TonB-dependent receptor [Alteromonas sp. 5E99-2]MBO1255327.1 TonB-dependent receptor [Alteromonas sp. 5E99-2]
MHSKFSSVRRSYKYTALRSLSPIAMAMIAASSNLYAEEVAEEELSGVEVVVVTASRRAESIQDVSVSVSALGEKQLEELGIDKFEDYVSLLPGVSAQGQGPGKQEIFIRGITPGRTGLRISGIAAEPSTAVYFDEAPISTGGRNIDIYAADLSRIEVLKGPQGTLFGASSQAGTIRLIPNKPVLNEFEAGGTIGFSTTKSGEDSNLSEGYVNLPVIDDKFAVRFVGYSSTEGGFVDNIPATRQLPLSNPTLADSNTIPSVRDSVANTAVAEDDFNDASYRGFRLSGLYKFNENWDLYVNHISQTIDSEGVFEFEPDVSTDDDFNVQTFTPDRGEDELSLTTWTLTGFANNLELIYNGSYTDRVFEGTTDYTGYANNGPFIPYYICTPGYDECGSPELFADVFFQTERLVQEIRFATDADKDWRIIGGLFYDDQEITERTNFVYPSSVEVGFQPNFPIPTAFASDTNVREIGVTFFNDFVRDREETSVFGEFSYDFTDTLTASFGFRHYSIDIGLTGQSSFGQRASGLEADGGLNVDSVLAGESPTTLEDTIYKFNVSWKPTKDTLLYGTYSEGFRSGSFNRNGTGNGEQDIPFAFDTDDVVNIEFGWKSQWFDNSLRFNGALFFIDFDDLQQGVLDFSISNVTFIDNVGSAEQRGLEFDLEWAANDNLTLFTSFTFLDSELTDIPDTLVNIAPVGSDLAYSPSYEGVVGGRYYYDVGDYTYFGQVVGQLVGSRFTSLAEDQRFELDSYEQVNLTLGVSNDNWTVNFFVDNLTDTVGELSAGAPDNVFRVVPTRPRTAGVRVSYQY